MKHRLAQYLLVFSLILLAAGAYSQTWPMVAPVQHRVPTSWSTDLIEFDAFVSYQATDGGALVVYLNSAQLLTTGTLTRWYTFNADTGSTTVDTYEDVFTFTGGTNIDTAIAGDVLTINVDGALVDGSNADALHGHDQLMDPGGFNIVAWADNSYWLNLNSDSTPTNSLSIYAGNALASFYTTVGGFLFYSAPAETAYVHVTDASANSAPYYHLSNDATNVSFVLDGADGDNLNFLYAGVREAMMNASGFYVTNDITLGGTVDGVDIAARDHAEAHTLVSHTAPYTLDADLDIVDAGGTALRLSKVAATDYHDFETDGSSLYVRGSGTSYTALRVGTVDAVRGGFYAYGHAAGSTTGGSFNAQTAADHDTAIDSYAFAAISDDLFVGPDTDTDSLKYDGGTGVWAFTGAAGVAIGACTYPVIDGADGEVLTTDGGGVVAWEAVPVAGAHTIDDHTAYVLTDATLEINTELGVAAYNPSAYQALHDMIFNIPDGAGYFTQTRYKGGGAPHQAEMFYGVYRTGSYDSTFFWKGYTTATGYHTMLTVDASGAIDAPTGPLTVNNAYVGAWPTATAYAVFGHEDHIGATDYCLIHHSGGQYTLLNSTFSTQIRVNSTAELTATTGLITVANDLTVGDDLIVTDDLTVGDDLIVTDDLTVALSTLADGNLTLQGAAYNIFKFYYASVLPTTYFGTMYHNGNSGGATITAGVLNGNHDAFRVRVAPNPDGVTGLATAMTIDADTTVGFPGTGTIDEEVHIELSQNGATRLKVENPNAGASAWAGVMLTTNGGTSYFRRAGTGIAAPYTDDTLLQDGGGGDIVLYGAAEIARFLNGGGLNITKASAGYALTITNDGNDVTRTGITLQIGEDDQTQAGVQGAFLECLDGDGGDEGGLVVISGVLQLEQGSDRSLKSDIRRSETNALDIVRSLPVSQFRYKMNAYGSSTKRAGTDDRRTTVPLQDGFIGQDVMEHYPRAARIETNPSSSMEGKIKIVPALLIPVAWKALQEQQGLVENQAAQIGQLDMVQDVLVNRINAQDEEIADLRKRLEALEKFHARPILQ